METGKHLKGLFLNEGNYFPPCLNAIFFKKVWLVAYQF